MADLSTLSETIPADTDLVSQGAGTIRDTRLATKTSVALEHGLAGEHKFPQGDTASRVAYALGRLYMNTQQRAINQGIAGQWTIAPAINIASFFNAVQFTLTGSYADWTSLVVNVPTGAFFAAIAWVELLLPTNSSTYSVSARFRLDGATTVDPGEQTVYLQFASTANAILGSMSTYFTMPCSSSAILSEGNHTIAFQMKFNTGITAPLIRNRFMAVIVG